jgi:hypothetical protein
MADDLELFGLPCGEAPRSLHYAVSCLGIFVFLLLPDIALRALHSQYRLLLPFFYTFLQFIGVTLTCLPALVRLLSSRKSLTVPLRFYLFLSLVLTASTALHHFAKFRLSQSTELLFKSPKLIPVMVGNFVFLKRPLTAPDVIVACLFVTGFVGIVISDFSDRGEYDVVGIIAVFLSLLLEAVSVNLQEHLLFSCRIPKRDLMALVFSLSSAVAFVPALIGGNFSVVVEKVISEPGVIGYLLAYSVLGAVGMHFVFFSLAAFGSMQTVLFTSLRKVVRAVGAAAMGGVAFAVWYRASACILAAGLTINAWAKAIDTTEKEEKPGFDPDPIEQSDNSILS